MNTAPPRPVFDCQMCGDCCQGQGGILVTPAEVAAMAAHLGLDREEFRRRYVVDTAMGPQLTAPGNRCIFVEERRCRVHPVKPRICRQWPFLPALLAHADEFDQAKGACPGLDPHCLHENFVAAAPKDGV